MQSPLANNEGPLEDTTVLRDAVAWMVESLVDIEAERIPKIRDWSSWASHAEQAAAGARDRERLVAACSVAVGVMRTVGDRHDEDLAQTVTEQLGAWVTALSGCVMSARDQDMLASLDTETALLKKLVGHIPSGADRQAQVKRHLDDRRDENVSAEPRANDRAEAAFAEVIAALEHSLPPEINADLAVDCLQSLQQVFAETEDARGRTICRQAIERIVAAKTDAATGAANDPPTAEILPGAIAELKQWALEYAPASPGSPLADGAEPDDELGTELGISRPAPDETTLGEVEDAPEAVQQELLDLFREEAQEVAKLARERILAASVDNHATTFSVLAETLQNLESVAETLNLRGLRGALAHLADNMRLESKRQFTGREDRHAVYWRWQEVVDAYLSDVGANGTDARIVDYLRDSRLAEPLQTESAADLLSRFGSLQLAVLPPEQSPRPNAAVPADVENTFSADLRLTVRDSLLEEIPTLALSFSAAVQQFGIAREGIDSVGDAQRAVHTLKGAANTGGLVGMANLAHHCEDILDACLKAGHKPVGALYDMLLEAADCIEAMAEGVAQGGPNPADALVVLQRLLEWANTVARVGVAAAGRESASVGGQPAATNVLPSQPNQSPTVVETAETADSTTPDSHGARLRVAESVVEKLLNVAGESLILTGQVRQRIDAVFSRLAMARVQNQSLRELAGQLEKLVLIQGVGSPLANTAKAAAAAAGDSVSGNFDPLEMDRFNELGTLALQLLEHTEDLNLLEEEIKTDFGVLQALLSSQAQLQRDNQDHLLQTRMVPIQEIVPRLQRSVRQAARLTAKQVELEISGEDTAIDSSIVSQLADPLMHLLRNAVDHGIEDAETRMSRGKPECGRISLVIEREGSTIKITLSDDGGGLDFSEIRQAAENQGLVSADQILSDRDHIDLISKPGFSTRSSANQISGRGFGMDIVHRRITDLKGSVRINSLPGSGCNVELNLPITLISTHAILVRVSGSTIALADRGIERLLHPEAGKAHRVGDALSYRIGKQIHALYILEDLLELPRKDATDKLLQRPGILVRTDGDLLTVITVDEVVDVMDLVVKNIGNYLPKPIGVLGATILGDGSVTPVVDLVDVVRDVQAHDHAGVRAGVPVVAVAEMTHKPPSALVVDDSVSTRQLVREMMAEAGYEVYEAANGLEATRLLLDTRPDLIVVDLEMPRMNGIQLTSHVRASEELKQIPIIMITSRSSAKHVNAAREAGVDGYLTKPLTEAKLLDEVAKASRARQ